MSSEKGIQESPTSPTPQFGLIDLVDSFTAFRHEFRNQARETRAARDVLEDAIARMEAVADGLFQQSTRLQESKAPGKTQPSNAPASPAANEPWIMNLIEFDIQWSRAVDAAQRNDEFLRNHREEAKRVFESTIESLSAWRRWVARPLIERWRQLPSDDINSEAMTDGLTILLSRLRQVLSEYQIERKEALGQTFDGAWMRSIGTVFVPLIPVGHVAQQISPAYFYQTRIVKFADVRVCSNI